MGRKKIEIRPLVDERNRNVTFLKRKAGLMKKAWELSVLCAADVSIMIFNANGKPFEFSSKDLDEEIQRYQDYEGLIERRRAPEFAAMALAGEDSEDDEDMPARRGSTSKTPAGGNGAVQGVTKSLKGKETYKTRTVIDRDSGDGHGHRVKGKGRDKTRVRSRREVNGKKRSFVEEILEGSDSEDSEEDETTPEGMMPDISRVRGGDRSRGIQSDHRASQSSNGNLSSLQYALNLHNGPAQPDVNHQMYNYPYARQTSSIPSIPQMPRIPRTSNGWNHRAPNHPHSYLENGPMPSSSTSQIPNPSHSYPYGQTHSHTNAPLTSNPAFYEYLAQEQAQAQSQAPPPLLPGNMQWDPQLLARYAEFQLQQNHQKQQRALLDKQRQQLAELGVPLDEKSLLDQLFGMGGSQAQGQGQGQGHVQGQGQGDQYLHEQGHGHGHGNGHGESSNGHGLNDNHTPNNGGGGGGGGAFEWPQVTSSGSRGIDHSSQDRERGEIFSHVGELGEPMIVGGSGQWGDEGVEDLEGGLPFPSPDSPGVEGYGMVKGKRGVRDYDDAGERRDEGHDKIPRWV